MSAGEMSDGSPISPQLDARLLADIREWRARLAPTSLEGNRWSARLTIDELDMLLRIADERDALKRAACAEWEADIPAEIRERAGAGPRRTVNCRCSVVPILPDGYALIDGEVVPLPAEKFGAHCHYCGGRVLLFAEGWLHDASEPSRGMHPAVPEQLPFCDCGSVDKNGDDLGEHGPRCPYHLSVLRISPTISARELDELCRRTLAAQARLA